MFPSAQALAWHVGECKLRIWKTANGDLVLLGEDSLRMARPTHGCLCSVGSKVVESVLRTESDEQRSSCVCAYASAFAGR